MGIIIKLRFSEWEEYVKIHLPFRLMVGDIIKLSEILTKDQFQKLTPALQKEIDYFLSYRVTLCYIGQCKTNSAIGGCELQEPYLETLIIKDC